MRHKLLQRFGLDLIDDIDRILKRDESVKEYLENHKQNSVDFEALYNLYFKEKKEKKEKYKKNKKLTESSLFEAVK